MKSCLNVPPPPRVDFVRSPSGSWEGLYVNGKLVAEGHFISAEQLAKALKAAGVELTVSKRVVDDGLFWSRGYFPPDLEGVPE